MSLALQGNHVTLRPFEPENAEALYPYLNHPDLAGRRYLPHGFPTDLPLSYKQVRAILEQWERTENRAHLAVLSRESEQLIGHASAYWGWDPHCPNVEVVISPAYQRRKFGSETLSLMVQWLFDTTPAHNISIEVADWNVSAKIFLQKMGFFEAGQSRREGIRQGKFYDLVLFEVLRREWKRRK